MRILCGMGKNTHDEFGVRAFLAFGGIRDAFEPPIPGVVFGGEGPLDGDWDAAICFDNDPHDRAFIMAMRAKGVPCVYSPTVGEIKDGVMQDPNAKGVGFPSDRKMKVSTADVVQFDTHEAEEAFCRLIGHRIQRRIVIPPAPECVPWVQRPLGTIPTKLFWIGDPGGFDVNAWAKAKGISVWECKSDSGGFRDRFRDEHLVLSEALACPSPVVLWAQRSKYGERLLTLVAHHIPVAAVRCGTLPDTEGVNWYDGDSGPGLALEAAMQGVKEEAELSPGSWMEWAKKVMGGLE